MDKLFEEYAEKYRPMMYSIIRGKYVPSYTQEDLIQEMLMVLHNAMDSYNKDTKVKFSTYLYTLLRNRINTLIRDNAKYNSEVTIDDDAKKVFDLIVSEDDHEYHERNEEIMKDIIKILLEIPRGYITYLIVVGGLTYQQVADKEGISRPRVLELHRRNISRLKEALGVNFNG